MSAWQNSDELPLEILDLMTREAGSCLAAGLAVPTGCLKGM